MDEEDYIYMDADEYSRRKLKVEIFVGVFTLIATLIGIAVYLGWIT